MTTTRRPLTTADLAPLARAALGRSRALTGVERLRGGTKKGVYRLTLDDDSTAVAYVWSADEDYWDQPDPAPGTSSRTARASACSRRPTTGSPPPVSAPPASGTPTPRTRTCPRTRPSSRTSLEAAWRTP